MCAPSSPPCRPPGWRPSTQARKLSALRQFFGFLYAEGIRTDDPTQAIEAPRASRPLPKILSGDDLDRMLATAAQDTSPEGLRLTLIVEMLYGGGLARQRAGGHENWRRCRRRRISSASTGKGNKERLSPLNKSARAALDAYLAVRGDFVPKHDKTNRYLFASRGEGGSLTRRRFHQLLKGLALKAGSIRQRFRRMCCATPSPPIWWRAGPTCAASRPCWAMPISPPPRSIPMWRATI